MNVGECAGILSSFFKAPESHVKRWMLFDLTEATLDLGSISPRPHHAVIIMPQGC